MSRMYNPCHPGELLREYIPQGITMARIATALGISVASLSRVLNAKAPVSPELAVRLAKWMDTSPELWLNMQMNYDIWHAEQRLKKEIKKIRKLIRPSS